MWGASFGRNFGPVVRQTAKLMNEYARCETHFPNTRYGPDTHYFQDRLSVKTLFALTEDQQNAPFILDELLIAGCSCLPYRII
jgi:hypothetical protein